MRKHVIHVLNRTGHAPLVRWDPANAAEVKTAEEAFGDLKEQKYHMFDASEPQETHTELKKFDPEVKEIVAFGQPQGG